MLFVLHVEYGVIFEVYHSQTVIFVVHVDYSVFYKVYVYQMILFVVFVNGHCLGGRS